jgi:hypothetical protein
MYIEPIQSVGDAFAGIDPRGVLLRSAYDPQVNAAIKAGLQAARQAGLKAPGTWLPTMKAWCIHWPAWGHVRRELRAAGCPLAAGRPPARTDTEEE